MAKAYKEGSGWAFRLRVKGQDIHRGGFASMKAAQKAVDALAAELDRADTPAMLGPHRTSVAQALGDYAREVLPSHKGAEQEARRINRFLREVKLPILELEAIEAAPVSVKAAMRTQKSEERAVHFRVSLRDELERSIPNSLRKHRASLNAEGAQSARLRNQLARTMVADVSRHQLQALVNQLEAEGCGMSTVKLEVAVLRQMFNHASRIWRWTHPHSNPAGSLKIKQQDNERDRILTEEEWVRIAPVLARSKNHCVFPLVCLMLETAMRSCEPLTRLRWEDVDWEQRIIALADGKTGKRLVPLSPGALGILRSVQDLGLGGAPQDRVFPTTYETISKAWSLARTEANIANIRLHDLRHTAATRYSFEFNGNVFLLKVVTGHKTLSMLSRYVNVNAQQVATLMHGEDLPPDAAPAGLHSDVMTVARRAQDVAAQVKQATRDRVAREQSLRRRRQMAEKVERLRPYGSTLPALVLEEPAPVKSNVVRVDFGRKVA